MKSLKNFSISTILNNPNKFPNRVLNTYPQHVKHVLNVSILENELFFYRKIFEKMTSKSIINIINSGKNFTSYDLHIFESIVDVLKNIMNRTIKYKNNRVIMNRYRIILLNNKDAVTLLNIINYAVFIMLENKNTEDNVKHIGYK